MLGKSSIGRIIAPDGTYNSDFSKNHITGTWHYTEHSTKQNGEAVDYLLSYQMINDEIVYEQYQTLKTGRFDE